MNLPFRRKKEEAISGNGISAKDFERLKNAGIIQQRVEPLPLGPGPSDLITMQIPEDECKKIPGAKVGHIGEVSVCYLPIRKEEGGARIVPLEIIE